MFRKRHMQITHLLGYNHNLYLHSATLLINAFSIFISIYMSGTYINTIFKLSNLFIHVYTHMYRCGYTCFADVISLHLRSSAICYLLF